MVEGAKAMKRLTLSLIPLVWLVLTGASQQDAPATPMVQPVPVPDPAPAPAVPATVEEDDGGRIVGGTDAAWDTAKWQAEIYTTFHYTEAQNIEDRALPPSRRSFLDQKEGWEKIHRCGGVYIGDNIVLTAAHCLVDNNHLSTSRRVRLGTAVLGQDGAGASFAIADPVIHKNFVNEEPYPNDIGLVRIIADNPAALRMRLAPMAIRLLGDKPGDRPTNSFDQLRVTGWGKTQARASGVRQFALNTTDTVNHGSAILQQVTLKMNNDACASEPRLSKRLTDKTICAKSPENGKDSCNGDSGGPMTRAQGNERVLVGIVSWGIGCALPGLPSVYTDVSAYREWIAQVKATLAVQRSAR